MPAHPNHQECADEDLVGLIGQRDTAAFDELYRRYRRRLLHYFYRMLGEDEDKAQDFLQEIFLKVIEKGRSFAPSQRFSTWVFAVAHHMCCNEYRRLEVRQHTGADVDGILPQSQECDRGIERVLDQKSFEESLRRELALLDQARRSTFLLRYQEGFTLREISAVLGCSPGTVKSRLFYTIRLLAEKLAVYDPCKTEET